MRNILSKIKAKKMIPAALLMIYVYIVFFLQTIKSADDISLVVAMALMPLSGTIVFFLFYLYEQLYEKDFHDARVMSNKNYLIRFCLLFIITFAFYMMYFGAQYPGGMSPDTVSQYSQALSGDYSDWHPVLHTLIFFTFPLSTGHRLGLIVFLQLVYFCMAFSYLVMTLFKNGCSGKIIGLLCVYVWVNPYLATYLMYPWKDIGLTIFATLLVAYYIQIVISKGKWLDSNTNIVLFAVVSVISGYMRHNAILFVLPMILIVLFYVVKERKKE